MQDIYRLLTEAESEELEELDQAFWEYPDRLAPLGLACYGLTPGSPLAGSHAPEREARGPRFASGGPGRSEDGS